MGSSSTMKALVFHAPFDVRLEDKPMPQIIEPTDVVLKTTAAALCGSELHRYRGHSRGNLEPGYITGHEGAGIVHEVGSAVKSFKKGDYVVVPFTTSCGECIQCEVGLTGRCIKGASFGSPALDGSQAEYFRVPLAESTLYPAPVELGDLVILMADIFPTGFNGTRNAFASIPQSLWSKQTIAVLGCGPVGMCAIVSALEYKPAQVFAIDSVAERLERAKELGAIPLNFKTDDVKAEIKKATKNRGADAVIEVVGHEDALRTAFELVRFGGKISVIGVHNGAVPFSAFEGYNHNTHIQFGRCPVRVVFKEALEVLLRNKDKFKDFIDVTLPALDESFADALTKFEKNQVNKVVYRPHGLDFPAGIKDKLSGT